MLSIVSCVVYGILHDQVTARICVEYFTVYQPPVFDTNDPTLLGIGWGILATWWVGAILGVPLATAARFGSRPRRSLDSLVRPIAVLFLCTAAFAFLAGLAGYVAASSDWVRPVSDLAASIPKEKHVPFLVDAWAHRASYLRVSGNSERRRFL
ncbi:MAG: hypothetical protein ACYTG0_13685 [Planctomycetota bacterium]